MKTILLIEDNLDILDNFTEYLEMEGYKILASNNGKEGVELAKKFMPDLIICDVLMPEMDGYEVLRLILGTAKTSEIPFIISSSMSEKGDRTSALELGADEYITKPFEVETLLKVIQKCIKYGSKKRAIKISANPYNYRIIQVPFFLPHVQR